MFRSLYSKLAAILTGLFCLVGLLFLAVTLFSTDMYQKEVNQGLNKFLARQIVSQKHLIQENRVNREALEEIFHMLMVINPGIEIYLLNPEGEILAFSAPRGKVKRTQVDLKPIKKWLESDMKTPLLGDNPRDPGGKKVFSAARIVVRDRLEGYLYVILGGEIYDSVVQKLKGSYILHLSVGMIAGSLIFALAAGLLLFALLTGRLKRLADRVDAFRKEGRLKGFETALRTDRPGADEIDRLALSFTQMAGQIEAQMDKLRRSDVHRRQLMANVSHDLRTPLATLQGYIETLLIKDRQLGDDERKSYLEIAIRHCERLNKLVNELLELAKLESDEVRLNREAFNLGELVLDVTQKFQLKAKAKGIEFTTDFQPDLPFVNADIGLIERVLENLIENAISYTPGGGNVSLKLRPMGRNISVQVSDTGIGISEQDLPHIFNRFYRLDQNRKSPSGHSGLGLAITKKILELHGQSIAVTSVPNSGTTFDFQLPVATSP